MNSLDTDLHELKCKALILRKTFMQHNRPSYNVALDKNGCDSTLKRYDTFDNAKGKQEL